ncbi:MAG: 16S rRNA (guanine(527)-N(7))-methyltransferase RsmG [Alphaproteobacteria bacterium]|nr:16S rRNA (guanine(527)-N(7))-methyltransferase RsmG [Alphaproteobacteria bacterium]
MSPEAFAESENVSRETMARLGIYVDELKRWQQKINLVSPKSLEDVWRRHIQDSAQLHPLITSGSKVLDMGSGAGFPGLVLAILGGLELHLVESDQRKSAFMREVARLTGTRVHIYNERIERLDPLAINFITARAVSSLDQLLELAQPFLSDGVQCLFLKGKSWQEELTAAKKNWKMRAENIPSRSDPEGVILKISEVRRDHRDPDNQPAPGKK